MLRWIALRESVVDHLIEQGTKVSLEHGGEKLSAKILARDGDQLTFTENRAGVESLSLEEIDPVQVATCMSKGTAEHKGTWVRTWAYAIAGDPRWKKLLRADDDEARAFRDDAEKVYPELLSLAEACTELEALARHRTPRTSREADEVLERIEKLRRAHGKRPQVSEKSEPLRELARAALDARFAALGLDGVLHGKVQELEGDRIRLTYDFNDEKQLEDFLSEPEYIASLRSVFGELHEETETKVVIKKGALVASGSTCLRHPLWFESMDRARYEFEYRKSVGGNGNAMRFMVGFYDSGSGSFAACMGFGDLLMRNKMTGLQDHCFQEEGLTFYFGNEYEVVYERDLDGLMHTKLDGKPRSELRSGGLHSGSIFLWYHTDLVVALSTLEFEGRVIPDAIETLRDSWVERQLTALGME
jgi:hypothetical protein